MPLFWQQTLLAEQPAILNSATAESAFSAMVTLGTSCNGQSYRGVHGINSQRKWLKNDRDQLITVGICYRVSWLSLPV